MDSRGERLGKKVLILPSQNFLTSEFSLIFWLTEQGR
jgi:hypothetical protein